MVNKTISIFLFIIFCTDLVFTSGSVSDNYTVGKENYMANSVSASLDLSKNISVNSGFALYHSSYTTSSYSFGTGLAPGKNSFLDINLSFYPEVENYKSNQFGICFSQKIKNTKLEIGYSSTKHSQYVRRPSKNVWEWFDLKQKALNLGIVQIHKKANISISYIGYDYNIDIEKLSKVLDYFSLKNTSLEWASSLVNGFAKNSVSVGFGYNISRFFSSRCNYSSINYKLEQPKSNSYLFEIIFYPTSEIEVLTEYNNFDKINYWTVGIGYYWR